MRVRVDGMGNVKVSDSYKKRIAKLKRDWGAEAIYMRMSPDRKSVNLMVLYTGTSPHLTMKVIK